MTSCKELEAKMLKLRNEQKRIIVKEEAQREKERSNKFARGELAAIEQRFKARRKQINIRKRNLKERTA